MFNDHAGQEPIEDGGTYIPYIFGLFFRPKFQGISPENVALNGTVPPLKWILKISH